MPEQVQRPGQEWISGRDLAQNGEVRLFCLPHAGSGAAGFQRWKRLLPASIAVCPVMLPGRESRLTEPAMHSAEAIVRALLDALRLHLPERPYAVFGHSMGALVSFRLAQRIEEERLPGPVRVFCSGREAPQFPAARLSGLDDPALLVALSQRFGPESTRLLHDAEMRALFLPSLRADLQVVDDFIAGPAPLRCGISAWAGAQDSSVTEAGLKGWERWSGRGFQTRHFAGSHFYTFGQGQAELLEELAAALTAPPC